MIPSTVMNTRPTKGNTTKTPAIITYIVHHKSVIIAFLMGLIIGTGTTTSWSKQDVGTTTGMIRQLSEVPYRATSHKDKNTGKSIMKQQFLEPFVVPHFVGFSVATFDAGQTMMPAHAHETLHEFFFVLEGSAVFVVDGVEHKVGPMTFFHLAPGESHGIYVPEDSVDGAMKMAVFGVVTNR
mmetsp:Transcript_24030/g.37050  ORF Transcript_24030/g.37050 Transcript_24030/m.37050 type:complete len:182 (-) Transcript_24030:374-919(-)